MENDFEKTVGLKLEIAMTRLEIAITDLIAEFEENYERAIESILIRRRDRTLRGRYVCWNKNNPVFPVRGVEIELKEDELVSVEWFMSAPESDRDDGAEGYGR